MKHIEEIAFDKELESDVEINMEFYHLIEV